MGMSGMTQPRCDLAEFLQSRRLVVESKQIVCDVLLGQRLTHVEQLSAGGGACVQYLDGRSVRILLPKCAYDEMSSVLSCLVLNGTFPLRPTGEVGGNLRFK